MLAPIFTSSRITVFLIACLVLAACHRASDTEEVRKLRAEVERLKASQSPPSQTAQPQTPQEYVNFVRAARRLITGLEAGLNYPTFRDRVGELSALALEADAATSDPEKKRLIALFTTALSDANDLWKCEIDNDSEPIHLHEIGGEHFYDYGAKRCGGRWQDHLQELITSYELDKSKNDYAVTSHYFNLDKSLQVIFKFCTATFRSLDQNQ